MSLVIKNLSKSFYQGSKQIRVLEDLSLEVATGRSISLVGPSGSGKSTLLSLIAGLDSPDSGQILIDGQNIASMNEAARTHFRLQNLSIIFQQFHLLPYLSAKENIMLPLEIAQTENPEKQALSILQKVGMTDRANHFPYQLSGGENQRIAFARAFVAKPKLLLADEPSGSLDAENGQQVIDLLFELTQLHQTTLVLVTHNEEVARRANQVFHFKARL